MSPTAAIGSTKSISDKVRDTVATRLAELEAESLATWRRWVKDIANGGTPPDAREILEIGANLGVRNPGVALEQDIEGWREHAAASASAANCRRMAKEILAEFKGDAAKLRAATQAAATEARRLADILSQVDDECGASFWASSMSQLERRCPRVFNPDFKVKPC